MTTSRERHARERLAIEGADINVSRELMRRVWRIHEALGEDEAHRRIMECGEKIAPLYAEIQGDTRKAVYVKIPAWVYDAAKAHAKAEGCTLADLITEALTQICGLEDEMNERVVAFLRSEAAHA